MTSLYNHVAKDLNVKRSITRRKLEFYVVMVNGKPLETVTSAKVLGLNISSD